MCPHCGKARAYALMKSVTKISKVGVESDQSQSPVLEKMGPRSIAKLSEVGAVLTQSKFTEKSNTESIAKLSNVGVAPNGLESKDFKPITKIAELKLKLDESESNHAKENWIWRAEKRSMEVPALIYWRRRRSWTTK